MADKLLGAALLLLPRLLSTATTDGKPSALIPRKLAGGAHSALLPQAAPPGGSPPSALSWFSAAALTASGTLPSTSLRGPYTATRPRAPSSGAVAYVVGTGTPLTVAPDVYFVFPANSASSASSRGVPLASSGALLPAPWRCPARGGAWGRGCGHHRH